MGDTLLQNNEHLFARSFSRTIQLLMKKKLIEEARSRFTVLNTIQTFTGGGMSKGLPLYIRDALHSQPTTHFCF
jgi:hypothetical protein